MNFLAKLIISFFLLVLIAGLGLYYSLPTAKEIRGCMVTKMYEVKLCPGSTDYVSLRNISRYMQRAVILTEDGTFFQHNGFNWESIEKNAKENFETGKYKRGGSTITQQLAKNMFLTPEKTLWRKGIEALITYRLEKYLTKKEILERYLNVVEFGKDIYGVKSAADYYFKKSPSELGILDSAFLAMVLPNPEKYSRSYYKKQLTPFAQRRIQRIVTDMWKTGLISESDYNQALQQMEHFFGAPVLKMPDPGSEEDRNLDEVDQFMSKQEQNAIKKLGTMKDDDSSLDEAPLDSTQSPPANDNSDDN